MDIILMVVSWLAMALAAATVIFGSLSAYMLIVMLLDGTEILPKKVDI